MTIRIDGTNTAANPGITGTDTDTGLQFGTDEVNIVTGGSTRTTVDSSGRVGIGTTTPSQKLHVASNASTYIQVQNTGDSVNAYYGVDTAAAWVGSSTNHPLVFHTNNTERARIDSSGNLRFNSGYGSVATAYGCRAWVNFKGTGTLTVRDSGNVSSVTDNGTGNYTVNLTNDMPDVNYSAQITGTSWNVGCYDQTTSTIQVLAVNQSWSYTDMDDLMVVVHR